MRYPRHSKHLPLEHSITFYQSSNNGSQCHSCTLGKTRQAVAYGIQGGKIQFFKS